MPTNLKAYDTFMEMSRQLLPWARLSQVYNLALLVVSLLQSSDSHLSSLAEGMALEASDQSLEQRIRRGLSNPQVAVRRWYAPFVQRALANYQAEVVYVILDSTAYGSSSRALVAGLAYGAQVLPLGWRILAGKKGHSDPALQLALLDEIRAYLPAQAQVELLADSEFSAVDLLAPLSTWGWQYIVRVRGTSTCNQPARLRVVSMLNRRSAGKRASGQRWLGRSSTTSAL